MSSQHTPMRQPGKIRHRHGRPNKSKGFWSSTKKISQHMPSCTQAGDKWSEVKYEDFITKLQVTPKVELLIQEIISMLRDIHPNCGDAETKAKYINSLLDECCRYCSIDSVVSYIDQSGYDLVQRVAAQGLEDIMDHILQLGYNVNLLDRRCTNPLHVACKKGHIKILELFLDYGAEVNSRSAVCFPIQHFCNPTSYSNDGARDLRWINQNCCVGRKHTLLSLAFCSDNVQILQTLNQRNHFQHLDTHMALYNACQRDAVRCLTFLAPILPEQANGRYGFQDSQSLFSVAFSKSVHCGRVLLQCNLKWEKDVLLRVNSIGESLLHLVFRHPDTQDLYSLVKLTMDKCFPKEHINALDLHDNTPLIVLLKMIGRKVNPPLSTTPNGDMCYDDMVDNYQRNWNEQMFDTVRYLVEQGADVHAKSKSGETVLHALLQDHFWRRLCGLNSTYYKEALPEIIRVLEYLLTFDVKIDSSSEQVASPFTWAVQILSSLEVYNIETTWPSFSYLFQLFLKNGANPNALDERGIHIISIIFTTVNRWLNQCMSDVNVGRACRMLRHITAFLHELFQHDIKLAEDVLELCMKQITILCNVSVPLEVAGEADALLQHISGLLLPFLLHGVDPHKIDMVTEKQNATEPCKLHAQFYLSRAFIIHRNTDAMFRFLDILESSLDQPHFNDLITSICSVLAHNFEDNSYRETSRCISVIKAKQKNARTLQTLCKVTICRQLQWRLYEHVSQLKIPKAMHKYLLYHVN